MHALEYILFTTSIAVEKGKISKRELAKVLLQLASASHSYQPTPFEAGPYANADAELGDNLGKEWHRRFDHLICGK